MLIFKYGFYASSIAQATYMKKVIICPKDDNLKDIIGTLDYSFSYDYYKDNGLYDCMVECMDTDVKIRKEMEDSACNMVSQKTWKNLVNKIIDCYVAKGIIRK